MCRGLIHQAPIVVARNEKDSSLRSEQAGRSHVCHYDADSCKEDSTVNLRANGLKSKILVGGMAEWFKAAVLKIAFRATGTGVRIPLPPPAPTNSNGFKSNTSRALKTKG
jgi:hypothetical protein